LTLADPPGAIEPVAKLPLSAVELCVDVSLLVHVTVVPTATFSGFGENAVVVRLRAPLTMVTLAVAPVAVGVGEEVGDVLLLQATIPSAARRITTHLVAMRGQSCKQPACRSRYSFRRSTSDVLMRGFENRK
jgi:hypothetical protein